MLEYEGIQYARVSAIIEPMSNLSYVKEHKKDVLAQRCEEGSTVHEAIEAFLRGEFPILGTEHMGYFESFKKWHTAIHPQVIIQEARYYCHEKRITGQIDSVMKIGRETVLVDYKTAAAKSPAWPYQAHLYGYLLEKNNVAIAKRYIFLKLDKSGKLPKVYEYKFDPFIHQKCMSLISDFWKKIPI